MFLCTHVNLEKIQGSRLISTFVTLKSTLGARLRRMRRAQRLSQAELARRLGISPSYLNLIEHNRRPLPAELLVRLHQLLPVDLHALAGGQETRTAAALLEAFGDPLLENVEVITSDVHDLAS